MKINKAIRAIMYDKKMTLSAMGNSLHKVDRKTGKTIALKGNDVSARLNNDNFSFEKAIEMLDVLGYEIVVQEKRRGNRRADQILIDQCDDNETQTEENPVAEKPKEDSSPLDLDALLEVEEKPKHRKIKLTNVQK